MNNKYVIVWFDGTDWQQLKVTCKNMTQANDFAFDALVESMREGPFYYAMTMEDAIKIHGPEWVEKID